MAKNQYDPRGRIGSSEVPNPGPCCSLTNDLLQELIDDHEACCAEINGHLNTIEVDTSSLPNILQINTLAFDKICQILDLQSRPRPQYVSIPVCMSVACTESFDVPFTEGIA